MLKKFVAVLLVIMTVFSVASVAVAADENTNSSNVNLTEIKDKIVYTLVEFTSKLNDTARKQLEGVITEKLVDYISSKTGLSVTDVEFIFDTSLKRAGIDGILHIDGEKASKFVNFMYDKFGEYLPNNSKVLADIYIWLASDKFGNWLDDIANGEDPTPNEDPTTPPAEGAFDRMMATITFFVNKLVTFFTSFFSYFLPLINPPAEAV